MLGAGHVCSSLSPKVLPVPSEAFRQPACQGPQSRWDREQLEAQPNLTRRAPWKRDGVSLQPRSPPFLLQALEQGTEGQNPILMCVSIPLCRYVHITLNPAKPQAPARGYCTREWEAGRDRAGVYSFGKKSNTAHLWVSGTNSARA